VFVLGIDPGLSRCGYGAVTQEGGQLRAVAIGHLSTAPDEQLSIRLGTLLDDLEALLADLHPDVVVVERVLFQVNARTAMSVGQASGLALAVSARAGIPVVQYSPNEVKQAVVGYGSASKDQVQRMVQTLLGLSDVPRPADRADALALAICHLSGARLRQAAAAADRQGTNPVAASRAAASRAAASPVAASRAAGR
jgi:crossover junction endodeoxyribonuclease RuvC